MTIDKWSIGGSAREPAHESERAGSARLGILASREKRLGSARSRLASRAAPSPSRLASRELFFQPYAHTNSKVDLEFCKLACYYSYQNALIFMDIQKIVTIHDLLLNMIHMTTF